MSEYTLSLTILGKDKVSGFFNHIDRSLRSIMNTALGVTVARVIEDIAESIGKLAIQSINAVAYVQVLQLTLEALATRELVQMSNGVKSVGDVAADAEEMAAGLMHELGRMAILSPYTLEATTNTYRMMVAFGSTTAQAKKLTGGLMTMGAGLGAGNEQIQRMGYNLAQIALQGKVTALDVRQLALAGLPLVDVLKAVGKEFDIVIEDHLDFNEALKSGKISWQDFVDTFEKYANENFGGASEKLARSLYGLKSTFGDVFALTMPRLLGGATDEVTAILSRLLDSFLYLYESPELGQIGENLATKVRGWLAPIATIVDNFVISLEQGQSLGEALKGAFTAGLEDPALGNLGQVFNTIGGYVTFFGQIFQTISPIISGTLGLIREIFATSILPILGQVVTAAQPLVEIFAVGFATAIADLLPIFNDFVTTVLPPLIDSFSEVLTVIMPLIGTVLPVLADLFSRLMIAVMPLVTTLLPVFASILETVVTAGLPLVDAILIPLIDLVGGLVAILAPFLAEYMPMIVDFAIQVLEALLPIITTLLPVLIPLILQLAEAMLPLIITLIPPLAQILVVLAEIITSVVVPIIIVLVEWLQVNLPVAIAWLTNAWNTVLLPALTAVGNFMQTVLLPIITVIFQWLQVNLPVALAFLSGIWNNVLLPALQAVWGFLSGSVFPLFEAIGEFIAAVFNKNLEIFAGWWENFILPALKAVVAFSEEHLLPIFQAIVDFYKATFFPVLKTFKETWLEGIVKTFDAIVGAIESVIGWLKKMADKLASIKLPDWLTRGSPSPFEITLTGINKGLMDVAKKGLPEFEAALQIKEVIYPDKFMDAINSSRSLPAPLSKPPITIETINNYISGGFDAVQYSIDRAKAVNV
jgi:tape measure domain-containing protein